MYIAYDIRNSVEYAKLVKSKRNGKRIEKKYTNLGRDLDKELQWLISCITGKDEFCTFETGKI